jgi:hypothetical protein
MRLPVFVFVHVSVALPCRPNAVYMPVIGHLPKQKRSFLDIVRILDHTELRTAGPDCHPFYMSET